MKLTAADLADPESVATARDWCRQTGAPFDDRIVSLSALPDALVVVSTLEPVAEGHCFVSVVYPWPEDDQ